MHACIVSRFSRVQLCAALQTAAHQAPLFTGFSRQEYWRGLPFPSPMTNLDSILKSRDITLPTKVLRVKAMVFPVVMYGCESWTIKKAEWQRIDAFELWWWRRLESPLNFKEIKPVHPKGNQHWIFIGRTDAEAETPILWPPDVKNWLIGKDLDAGKYWRWEEKGMTGWDGWMASPTWWTWVWAGSGSWWWTGKPDVLQSVGSQRVGHDWATELNWTDTSRVSQSAH